MKQNIITLKCINIDQSKQALKRCLEQSNLSQNYISMVMRVSPQAVSSWFSLHTKKMPTTENLINLSHIMGVDCKDVLVLDEVKVQLDKETLRYMY